MTSTHYFICHAIQLHRDLKPENILVNPHTGILKLADLGCGKIIKNNKWNMTDF